MMSSHDDDDDVHHNPPRRGTRSWSTPDPVSRGRRYSHHSRRKNEKDGGFNTKNKSVLFSSKERRERERERKRKERRIGTIQLHSLITRERIILVSSRIQSSKKRTPPPPPPHLARAVHHSEGRAGQTRRHLFLVKRKESFVL